jgi:2',3'-cyclic-nucleotide 2'-phosphodiesterase (5'-nucleotidase family)
MFKYPPILEFANMVNYTAMGLGNHDFDDGVEGIVPFIEGANFAVLASNINAKDAPELVKVLF